MEVLSASISGCVAVLSRATGFIPKSVQVVYFLTTSLPLESDDCVHALYCSFVAVASESPTLTSVKGNFQRTKWSVWILVFYSAMFSIFVAYGTSFQVKTVLF